MAVRPRFLGPADDGRAELAASPLRRIEPAACPPFLVTYGEKDFGHLAAQAREFVDALRAAGVPVAVEALPGCDHFEASIASGDAGRPWVASAARWMHQSGARASTTGELS
jgi:acetyl esterase/lipase